MRSVLLAELKYARILLMLVEETLNMRWKNEHVVHEETAV